MPIIERTMPALPEPASHTLAQARRVRASRAEHDWLAARLPCLQAVELLPPPQPQALGNRVRIAAWNAERCKYLPESAALLAGICADVVLLTELDVGMARSGNRHTVRELAGKLGAGYAFGVEYVELGLGDDREKAWHAHETNAVGLHGNAILSMVPLERPAVVRLDDGARWFAGEQSTNERRIGARMAMVASLDAGGTPLLVASVHLESSTDAADRAAQVAMLLRAVEERAGNHAVIIGGDFNTSAFPPADTQDGAWFERAATYEPMFALFSAAGYDWRTANTAQATERMRPDGTPEPPYRKIDWFFTRGAAVQRAFTAAAIDSAGAAISDHDALVIDVVGR
jgi:endonuclease/exonuclease/phosphatase family metal-dependent hydrolase